MGKQIPVLFFFFLRWDKLYFNLFAIPLVLPHSAPANFDREG